MGGNAQSWYHYESDKIAGVILRVKSQLVFLAMKYSQRDKHCDGLTHARLMSDLSFLREVAQRTVIAQSREGRPPRLTVHQARAHRVEAPERS